MKNLHFEIEPKFWKNQKQTITKRETAISFNQNKHQIRSYHNFYNFHNSDILSDRLFDLLEVVKHTLFIDCLVHSGKSYNLQVTMPVYDIQFWKQKNIVQNLKELLFYFTHNYWDFEFYKDQTVPPHQNHRLNFSPEKYEIVLWSGGLDAFSGLLNRIQENKNFILASFESSKWKRGLQTKLLKDIKKISKKHIERAVYIYDVDWDKINKKGRIKNQYARTRGLFFIICGLVLSKILKQKTLYMYENGAGFLNIMLPGNSGLDQSISATPETYRKCLHFFSLVSGENMSIQNPFGFKTKGEVCRSIGDSNYKHLIFHTSSCDSRLRQSPCECGKCSSCILRRLSIYAAGLNDQTKYVTQLAELIDQPAFRLMREQVDILKKLILENDANSLYEYSKNLILNREACDELYNISKNQFERNIFSYIRKYIQEWDKFENYLSIQRNLFFNREVAYA